MRIFRRSDADPISEPTTLRRAVYDRLSNPFHRAGDYWRSINPQTRLAIGAFSGIIALNVAALAASHFLYDPNVHISYVSGYYDHATSIGGRTVEMHTFNHNPLEHDVCTDVHFKDPSAYDRFAEWLKDLKFGDGVSLKEGGDFYMTPCKS